jgi:methylated-DNA-[protein]-cysteine S-methyltransferase
MKVETPWGTMVLRATPRGLREARFGIPGPAGDLPPPPETEGETVLEEALLFLRAYVEGRPYPLPPLDLTGIPPFHREVYRATMSIPWGETRTYGELARDIGRGSPRAVGQALGRNPLLLFIPCHRVVGSGGRAGGYLAGREIKEKLLRHEGVRL